MKDKQIYSYCLLPSQVAFSATSQAIISLNVKEIRLSLSIIMPESVVSIKSFEMPCLNLYLASPVKMTNDRRANMSLLVIILCKMPCLLMLTKYNIDALVFTDKFHDAF